MTNKKSESEFEVVPVGASARCWQIDNDHVPPPLDDGEWETQFAEALIDLAEAHETSTLVCLFHAGPSTDFGHDGYSVWMTLAGSGPLVKAASDILVELIPSHCVRASTTASREHRQPRIRIQDGHVWTPYEGADWMALAASEAAAEDVEQDDLPASEQADEPEDPGITPSPRKRKKALNAARDDVRVGYYQRKIERLLSLPEGSVKFVNPDRSISHPAQLIGSLRGRWEDG